MRITASSAACSTATQTDVNALQTSTTSSIPNRSADAIRASSRRRNVRAAAIARTGSACRPADATNARATPSGSTSSSFGPVGPSAYCWITSGARINRSGTYADVPSTRISRFATAPSSRRVDRYHRWSDNSSLIRRYDNKPASGSGVSDSQSSSVGSSTCCTRPRRPLAPVSAARCVKALCGPSYPSAAS